MPNGEPLSDDEFSPRTGGWSEQTDCLRKRLDVLPPHGGMVRRQKGRQGGKLCSPPARGDGPPDLVPMSGDEVFSPRTGGWSVRRVFEGRRPPVLPPHGGMVRDNWMAGASASSSPPARGDGPLALIYWPLQFLFSPRTGGWSESAAAGGAIRNVLPPHGGMVRRGYYERDIPGCSPPARGDGPEGGGDGGQTVEFSPRTGGWSELWNTCCPSLPVLPPHGGMVRLPPNCYALGGCSPPARGDGPTLKAPKGATK